MQIHFLGGATTVTGSQYLLETGQARVLIDCGMFQGSPNESIRNRVPFAFDPRDLDAVLLTHAHLDHCGLLPLLVKDGYAGPIHATAGTIELATLVLLDSGKLHEEFAKREARWEQRHPDRVAEDDRKEEAAYEAALGRATAGLQPYLYNLYAYRGEALRAAGRYEEAVADLSRAIALYPHPEYYHFRGLALKELGRLPEAAADAARAGEATGPLGWYWDRHEQQK